MQKLQHDDASAIVPIRLPARAKELLVQLARELDTTPSELTRASLQMMAALLTLKGESSGE